MKLNPFDDQAAGPGTFNPQFAPKAQRKSFVITDPTPRGQPRLDIPVPPGVRFVWDNLSLRAGYMRFKGGYAEVFQPLGTPVELPVGANEDDWQPATKSLVLLEAFGEYPTSLRELTITGDICLRAMNTAFKLFGYNEAAQKGQIGIFKIHEFTDAPTAYGIYGAPRIELVDFIDRDEDFGPALIAPPVPLLGRSSGAVPPQIEKPKSDSGSSPPPPPSAASPPKPPPAINPFKPPEPKPSADQGSRFRPVPSGDRRKPF